jgi:16S rRNA (guanine527-N7)-methyltransferase
VTFAASLAASAAESGLFLTQAQQDAFSRYNELLLAWNEKINLTTITDPQEVAVKHVIDSLSCYDKAYFPPAAAVIDVGTGAGFPVCRSKSSVPKSALPCSTPLTNGLISSARSLSVWA